MKIILTLTIRLFTTFLIAWISFSYWHNTDLYFTGILGISIVATAINYFIGDLLVSPRLGNISALILDGVSASVAAYFIIIWITNIVTTLIPLIAFGILITFNELFIHIFVTITTPAAEDKQDIWNRQRNNNLNFSTEFGQELQPTPYYNNLTHAAYSNRKSRYSDTVANNINPVVDLMTASNFEMNRIKSNIENPNV